MIFIFEKSTDEAQNFRKFSKPMGNYCLDTRRLPNKTNRNVLASKLRPVKSFKDRKKQKSKMFRRRPETIGTASPQTEARHSKVGGYHQAPPDSF